MSEDTTVNVLTAHKQGVVDGIEHPTELTCGTSYDTRVTQAAYDVGVDLGQSIGKRIEKWFNLGVHAGVLGDVYDGPMPDADNHDVIDKNWFAAGIDAGQQVIKREILKVTRENLITSFSCASATAINGLWHAHQGRQLSDDEVAGLGKLMFDFFKEIR